MSHLLYPGWKILSISINIIGYIYWRNLPPLKCPYWHIFQEILHVWAILLIILFFPLDHSSENVTCLSDLIGQIKLIVLSSRIILKTSVHFTQYYWLIYLYEKLYLFSSFLLVHILDQFQYIKSVQIEKNLSYLRKYI